MSQLVANTSGLLASPSKLVAGLVTAGQFPCLPVTPSVSFAAAKELESAINRVSNSAMMRKLVGKMLARPPVESCSADMGKKRWNKGHYAVRMQMLAVGFCNSLWGSLQRWHIGSLSGIHIFTLLFGNTLTGPRVRGSGGLPTLTLAHVR